MSIGTKGCGCLGSGSFDSLQPHADGQAIPGRRLSRTGVTVPRTVQRDRVARTFARRRHRPHEGHHLQNMPIVWVWASSAARLCSEPTWSCSLGELVDDEGLYHPLSAPSRLCRRFRALHPRRCLASIWLRERLRYARGPGVLAACCGVGKRWRNTGGGWCTRQSRRA